MMCLHSFENKMKQSQYMRVVHTIKYCFEAMICRRYKLRSILGRDRPKQLERRGEEEKRKR